MEKEFGSYFGKMPIPAVLIKVQLDEHMMPCEFQIEDFNQATMELFQLGSGEELRREAQQVFCESSYEWMDCYYEAAYEGKQNMTHIFSPRSQKYLNIVCYPYCKGYCICLLMDETDLVKSHKEMEKCSQYDFLTDLQNRNSYISYCRKFIHRDVKSLGMIFLDINGLKYINDTYGHDQGDQMIIFVAQLMKKHFFCGNLFRISGDEFLVIQEECSRQEFYDKAEVFVDALTKDGYQVASCGCVWRNHPESINEIKMIADERMYENKKKFHENELEYHLKKQHLLEKLLYDLANQRYTVYLQPKESLITGEIHAAEALVRYRNKDDKIVGADAFIPVFEEDLIISYIDFFVFEHVCKHLKEWRGKMSGKLKVSTNFSGLTLAEEGFVDRIEEIRARYGVDVRQLSVEISEGSRACSKEELQILLKQLDELGYTVELDDFGKEYSSIEMLYSDNIHIIKVDREFMEHMRSSQKSGELMRYICNYCHEMGKVCLAEGVETEEEMNLLKEMGYDAAQGYYIGKPVEITSFEKEIREK